MKFRLACRYIKSRLKKTLQGVILAEQLLKTNQGVIYRAKVKVMLNPFFRFVHAQSGKNGPGFRYCSTDLPLPRQYVPVENGSHHN